MHANPFSDAEMARRLAAVRGAMAADGVDIALLSAPENVFYLTGLDHWGYFAPHVLIVAATGEMVLVTRAMERVTIANMVRNARFLGHDDSETAAAAVRRHLAGHCAGRVLGIEAWSAGMSQGMGAALEAALAPAACIADRSFWNWRAAWRATTLRWAGWCISAIFPRRMRRWPR